MLAAALAAALRAALAATGPGGPACFNLLLREADQAASPLAAARSELAPHVEGLFCEAAARGARGALQALLVCLPEHDAGLGPTALAAARAAGQAGAAADIELLLALRRAAAGDEDGPCREWAAGALPAAAAGARPLPAPLCGAHGSGGLGSAADVHVIIEASGGSCSSGGGGGPCVPGSCCASPASAAGVPAASGTGAPAGASSPRTRRCACCGAGGRASASSMSSSSSDSDCGGGAVSDGSGAAPMVSDDAAPARDDSMGVPDQPPPRPACRVRTGLRDAVAADDVVRAAQLLTELVGASGAGGSLDGEQPLDAFILDLVTISAAAGTCDCAHLLLTAVGSSDDEELKAQACRALALTAAAAGRAALLRVAAAHHAFFSDALTAGGGGLARRAALAAALAGHPHTAVWFVRRAPAPAAARAHVQGMLSLPAWQLRHEAAALAAEAAGAGAPPGLAARGQRGRGHGKDAAARLDARALVEAFDAAWLASEARGHA
jgi:hypothetical protein